jgi:hypothetical protein
MTDTKPPSDETFQNVAMNEPILDARFTLMMFCGRMGPRGQPMSLSDCLYLLQQTYPCLKPACIEPPSYRGATSGG